MLEFRTSTLCGLLLAWPGWAGPSPEPPARPKAVYSAPIPEIKAVALQSFHNLAHPDNKVRALSNYMAVQPRIEDEKQVYFKDYVELMSEKGDIFFYDILFATDKATGVIRFRIEEAVESRCPDFATPKNTRTKCPSHGKHPAVGNFYKVSNSRIFHPGKNPDYPFLARYFTVSKEVTVKIHLDAAGTPTRYDIVQGHPLLNQAVMDYARQCRFSPATINDAPIASAQTLVLPFRVKPQPGPAAPTAASEPRVTGDTRDSAYGKAVDLWRQGDHAAASALFGRIHRLDPDFRLTRFYLALDALDRDQQKTAWDLLKAFSATQGASGASEDRLARDAARVMLEALGDGSRLTDRAGTVQGIPLT
ncbi:TonB family protein [Mesoterricola sediminis]|uniref:TonB C-terminal domain-containing protein n=1 Tax=Mesoterricola sediminis TaxID=2927980 RepID=A0AA48GRG8_9BACT|nr:TonB family protein [Mesoterricola sediminis]BDU76227.1 hypothetical protein METESE_11850 [Mesoterricola sediminis]